MKKTITLFTICLLLMQVSCGSSNHGGSEFIGQWKVQGTENSLFDISKQGENFIIKGSYNKDTRLEGIYTLTPEHNLTSTKGWSTFVIMYDQNSKTLTVSGWGPSLVTLLKVEPK